MKRYRAYIICTSPRSGSTLMCRLLAATGRAGHPDSHFHAPSIEAWVGYHGIAPDSVSSERELVAAIVHAARERGTGDTGIFGLRLQRTSADFLLEKLAVLAPDRSRDVDRVEAAFGRTSFIHLTRRDKLEQAISLVKATQTGLWHRAPDGTELERLSEPREPVYDAAAIAHQRAALSDMDAQWRAWFAREGVDPLRVEYDDLSADPMEVLAGILDHLGLDRALARDVALPVARLADAISERWAKRFLAGERRPGARG